MSAFLAWHVERELKGGEGKPASPAPPLEGDDVRAWNFYCRNATQFVKDFGLMESRIRRLRLNEATREVFEEKLDMIHEAGLAIDIQKVRETFAKKPEGGGDMLLAADPT